MGTSHHPLPAPMRWSVLIGGDILLDPPPKIASPNTNFKFHFYGHGATNA